MKLPQNQSVRSWHDQHILFLQRFLIAWQEWSQKEGLRSSIPPARCTHLTTGRILLVRPEPISLFGMPLLTQKKYSKFIASNSICPGQGLDGHLLFSFYFTSLCFSLSNWYIFLFWCFLSGSQDPKTSFSASGYQAHLCFDPLGGHLTV